MSSDYGKSKLKEDLENVKKDFSALKESGANAFEHGANDLKDNIAELYDGVKENAGEIMGQIKRNIPTQEEVRDQIAKVGDDFSSAVRKKPVEALAIAGLVGLVAGILLTKRS